MKSSSELKIEAKQMLQGRWKEAVLMNLVPTLIIIGITMIVLIPVILAAIALFAFISSHPEFFDQAGTSYTDSSYSGNSGAASFNPFGIIGSLLEVVFATGISWTFLDALRGQHDRFEISDAFRGFKSPFLAGNVAITLLMSIFIWLWSLLFVIPGIIKRYAYSQAYFIYYDIIEGTGQRPKFLDCITASRRLMDGYKGKLFWLDVTFIGWHLLALMSCGIGYLWLTPYISATKAAFYNNLPSETKVY